jgi:hypothetical protein
VDLLSGGRVDVGAGRGYQSVEFDAFGVPLAEARARTDEAIAILLWTARTASAAAPSGPRRARSGSSRSMASEVPAKRRSAQPTIVGEGDDGGLSSVVGNDRGRERLSDGPGQGANRRPEGVCLYGGAGAIRSRVRCGRDRGPP